MAGVEVIIGGANEVVQEPAQATSAGTSTVLKKSQDITDLGSLTKTVETIFCKVDVEICTAIWMWGSLSVVLIFGLGFFYIHYLSVEIGDKWTANVIYHSIIKISFVSLIVSLITFSVKMLVKNISTHERNQHKIAVIRAMPTLVNAADGDDQKKSAYDKVLSMILANELAKSPDVDIKPETAIELASKLLDKAKG